MKRIIINADDFGLTSGINRAISESHQNGVLTSATLMSGAPAFDEAISIAYRNPDLGVGCHVVLVDGVPLLPTSRVRSLVQPASSRFPSQLKVVIGRAISGRLNARELEAEMTEQIRVIQRTGIEVTHVDTHKHSHWVPAIFLPLMRAARACGVRAIRNPFPALPMTFPSAARSPQCLKRWTKQRLLAKYARHFLQAAKELEMQTTDGVIGVFEPFFSTVEELSETLAGLTAGTWEVVSHPGYCDSALHSVSTVLREGRERQLSILTSNALVQFLKERHFELCSFRESSVQPPETCAGTIVDAHSV